MELLTALSSNTFGKIRHLRCFSIRLHASLTEACSFAFRLTSYSRTALPSNFISILARPLTFRSHGLLILDEIKR